MSMLFHNSVETYARPVAEVGLRGQVARRHNWELSGGVEFWKAVGKFACVIAAVLLVCQAVGGEYRGGLQESAAVAESTRHDRVDKHISLLAKRATLLTPQRIEAAAQEALSLNVPAPGQVQRYNVHKGRFERL